MRYTIKQGDNLWNLAKKYLGKGANYTQIMKANNWTNPNQLIKPGDVIIIPTSKTTDGKSETATSTTTKPSTNTATKPTANIYLTAIKDIPKEYIPYDIKDPSGRTKLFEDVLQDNPNYEIYTDENSKPLTAQEFQQLNGDRIIPKVQRPQRSILELAFTPAYDNPILGERRVKNYNRASKRAEKKKDMGLPSYLDTMREGQDIAANAAITLFAYPALAGQLYNGATAAYSAGRLLPYTAQLAAGTGGALAGGYAFDKAVYDATGTSFTQAAMNNGMWDSNAILLNPGSWAGSGFASKLIGNTSNFVANQPRMTITPKGAVTIQPGETVYVDNVQGIPGGNRVSANGSTYKAGFGSKHGGSYGNHRVSSGGRGRNGKSTYGYNPYSEVKGTSSNISDVGAYTNAAPLVNNPAIYLPAGFAMQNGPYRGSFPEVTILGNVPRYEEYSGAKSPWELWYGLQPEGTVQQYTGSDRPGSYLIDRSGNVQTERRRVGNSQGWVAPDSTTYQYVTVPPRNEVNRLVGRMDPNATISTVEQIDISRAKNK